MMEMTSQAGSPNHHHVCQESYHCEHFFNMGTPSIMALDCQYQKLQEQIFALQELCTSQPRLLAKIENFTALTVEVEALENEQAVSRLRIIGFKETPATIVTLVCAQLLR